jgi:hypothetical protein
MFSALPKELNQMNITLPLRSNFWTFHDDPVSVRKKLLFIWDEWYRVRRERYVKMLQTSHCANQVPATFIEEHIVTMKPKVVIIGEGIWFIWPGNKNMTGYEDALTNYLSSLMSVARKVDMLSTNTWPNH